MEMRFKTLSDKFRIQSKALSWFGASIFQSQIVIEHKLLFEGSRVKSLNNFIVFIQKYVPLCFVLWALVIFRENWFRVLFRFLYQKYFVLSSFSNKVFFSKNMTAAFTVDDRTQWGRKAGSDVLCKNNPIKVSLRMYEISQVFANSAKYRE